MISALSTMICFLLVYAVVWFFPEYYMDEEYPVWMQQKDYINKINDKKEVLCLGDSRMKADLMPKLVDESVYNMALGGSSPIEMYYTLLNYMKYHPIPKAVIIGFAPLHYSSLDMRYKRNFYFHYFNYNEMLESQEQIFRSNNVPTKIQYKELVELHNYALRSPYKYYKTLILSKMQRINSYKSMYDSCAKSRGHMYFGQEEKNNIMNQEAHLSNFTVLQSNDFYMRKLLLLCIYNDIPVYIEQLPMNLASYEAINKSGYYIQYQKYMDELAKISGVIVNKEIPCYSDDMFGDNSHLNRKGAKIYSTYFKKKYFDNVCNEITLTSATERIK